MGVLIRVVPMSSINGNQPRPEALQGRPETAVIRIATAGDVHCRETQRDEVEAAFSGLRDKADIVLLAGDLTMHGDPAEAAVLAGAAREAGLPVFAVLGNHDWHAGHQDEITSELREAGVTVLDRDHAICEAAGVETGIVGVKGFVGGFAGSHMPDFGEPALRQVYAETSAEVDALDRGLRAVAVCPVRIVLLHYAPTESTLEGEPPGIWTFLGTDRLAAPIAEHCPDLVVHGHAHAGRFEGRVASVPVFNVSVPVMQQDFWIFELSGVTPTATSVH
jgi:Icc-related predicted phosphoesterase